MWRSRSAEPRTRGIVRRILAHNVFKPKVIDQLAGRPETQSHGWAYSDGHLGGPGNRERHLREALPTFLAKAQEDAEVRRALARLGYRRVWQAYSRQRKNSTGSEPFLGLAGQGLSPSLEFVGNWLNEEKQRIRAEVRSTFVTAMLSAIVAGLAFAFVFMMLR